MGYQFNFAGLLSGPYLAAFLQGIGTTLLLFVASWSIAAVLAVVLTALRASGLRAFTLTIPLYVEYHRNVPLLVQMLFWYFGISTILPEALNDFINNHQSESVFAVISLSLYAAAYISEDLRSGLRSIPKGQYEAARSLGLSYMQTMRLVIIPQTWRAALPPLTSQTLLLFKGTSLAAIIGVGELSYQAREIESQSFRVFEVFSIATVAYMIGSFSIMFAGSRLSKRYRLRTAHRQ